MSEPTPVILEVPTSQPSLATPIVQDLESPPHPSSQPRFLGLGTMDSPFVVDWDLQDTENPYNWPLLKKWLITILLAAGTWCVSFSSSAYSGGIPFTMVDLHMSRELANLGISLYVLGFGLGPLFFAPLSEMYGRRIVFMCTYAPYTLLHLGGSLARNPQTLLTCRLLAGIAGSSPLTNAGGTIADIWNARERGMASALYATAPFLGPVTGPIVGGFVSQTPRLGWRFSFWLMFIFSGTIFILGVLFMPETYAPVLLRRRAHRLGLESDGRAHFISKYDVTRSTAFVDVMKTNLKRPFVFLFSEPIVTLLAVYISIAYAILYALFAAFPIVFEEHRNFTAGQGGLAFTGVGIGIIIGTSLTPIQNRIYWRAMDRSLSGRAAPEERLYSAMTGAFFLPLGLFWFAWTTPPSISAIVPIVAGIPFGTGIAQILQSLVAYLMDTYTIFSASAIAATVVLRSILAAAFPLFSPALFAGLGDVWACNIFAFLALSCLPMPLLFWKYGKWIRSKSKYAIKDDFPEDLNSPPAQAKPDTTANESRGEPGSGINSARDRIPLWEKPAVADTSGGPESDVNVGL